MTKELLFLLLALTGGTTVFLLLPKILAKQGVGCLP